MAISNKKNIDRSMILKKARKIVIKIGTNVLTSAGHRLDTSLMEHLCLQVCWLMEQGRQVIIVTSGAIGAGMQILGWKKRPTQMAKLQAAASVGQRRLMRFYERIFREEGYNVGQVLLTRDIFESKQGRANALSTLETLLSYKIIPVINENDAVAFEEISFGDNDQLSAMVVELIGADVLVLLTDVDGLYDSDPKNNGKIKLITEVRGITEKYISIAREGKPSKLGSGGMEAKKLAMKKGLETGCFGIIANGKKPWVIKNIFTGKNEGTIFIPEGR
ncbi:MAG: glutamate 5-kinase [bacterium]|nr:glutamate 5-kinase [bacterium]